MPSRIEASRPENKVTARAGQTKAPISSPPQSVEGSSDESSMSQMTLFREESSSEEGSEDREDAKSSIAPS